MKAYLFAFKCCHTDNPKVFEEAIERHQSYVSDKTADDTIRLECPDELWAGFPETD